MLTDGYGNCLILKLSNLNVKFGFKDEHIIHFISSQPLNKFCITENYQGVAESIEIIFEKAEFEI